MIQILFALLAGILTIGAPCILPLLPILLGTSVGQKSKTRPLFIVLGFVIMFAIVGLLLSYLTQNLHLSAASLRNGAIVLLAIFGALMIWPLPFELLTQKMNGFINKANQTGQSAGTGNFGGFILGIMLGVIWTPCAGPVLGAILTLIATQGNSGKSVLLLFAYAIGAGIPMLLIAYGSQYITTKVRAISQYSRLIQQIFGVLILLLAFAMFKQLDVKITNALTARFPSTAGLESKLAGNPNTQNDSSKKYGSAPDFTGISHWLNSNPLTMQQLKGKVVLIDFWTYSCINCIRTLPYVTKWYDTYKDQGLVVIGVHTPEFAFEKETNNVQSAIEQFKIHYPVAQDNDYGTWNAYHNQYWPAEYLIDKNGNIVEEHFGEGNYDQTENAIRQQLGLGMDTNAKTSTLGNIQSPEMYFGARLQNLSPQQSASINEKTYTLPASLDVNTFALAGTWKFDSEKTTLTKPDGKIKLHFSSGKVFMVAQSLGKTQSLKITVDGKQQPDVSISGSQLYTLFDSTDYTDHTIEIDIPEAGFDAFTFTFG